MRSRSQVPDSWPDPAVTGVWSSFVDSQLVFQGQASIQLDSATPTVGVWFSFVGERLVFRKALSSLRQPANSRNKLI
jgi:hypothetical protein